MPYGDDPGGFGDIAASMGGNQQRIFQPPTPAPFPGAGGGGGGGGGAAAGLGQMAGMAMKILPMLLAKGGLVDHHDSHTDPEFSDMMDEMAAAVSGTHPDIDQSAHDYVQYLFSGGEVGMQEGGMPDDDEGGSAAGGMGMEGGGDTHEGLVQGEGGGMDDAIPAQSEDQNIQLSNGEFVVPADVVAMLGDGSTDAGAQRLYELVDSIRQMKYGHSEQPPPTPDDAFENLLGGEGGGPATQADGAQMPPPQQMPQQPAA